MPSSTPKKKIQSPYQEGHLFVAAIRLLEHRHAAPPPIDQIASILNLSVEQTGFISRRLIEAGVVKIVASAFGDRWGVDDHLKLEALPREAEESPMDEALKKFKSEKGKLARKVASIKVQQAQNRKDLFSEIEKRLKKDLSST